MVVVVVTVAEVVKMSAICARAIGYVLNKDVHSIISPGRHTVINVPPLNPAMREAMSFVREIGLVLLAKPIISQEGPIVSSAICPVKMLVVLAVVVLMVVVAIVVVVVISVPVIGIVAPVTHIILQIRRLVINAALGREMVLMEGINEVTIVIGEVVIVSDVNGMTTTEMNNIDLIRDTSSHTILWIKECSVVQEIINSNIYKFQRMNQKAGFAFVVEEKEFGFSR